jgi:CheY-like chemotaxis protein
VNKPAREIGGDLNDAGPMEAALVHALLLDESPSDADKLENCLISSGLGLKSRRIASRRDYLDAIDAGGFEIILANHSLPDIDGLTALRIAKDRYPDVPFIFVSDAAGKQFANDARKQGAIDCVLKQDLPRLPVTVDRALAEARARGQRRSAEATRLESEIRLRLAFSAAGLGTWDYTPDQDELVWRIGDAEERRTTYEGFMARVHPIDRARIEPALRAVQKPFREADLADKIGRSLRMAHG